MGVRFGREGDEWRSKQASAALTADADQALAKLAALISSCPYPAQVSAEALLQAAAIITLPLEDRVKAFRQDDIHPLVKYALGAYLWISERESDRDTAAGGQR